DPALGTGIRWTAEQVELWERGSITATAAHDTPSAWAFWHGLRFRDAFPEVTHWWFRGIWTGRLAISRPDPELTSEGQLVGWVTFDLLDQPRRAWSINEGAVLTVAVPLPPLAEQPGNLPLQLSIARAVLLVLQGDAPADSWLGVTSLVAREELERTLPATHAEARAALGGNWRLANGAEPFADPPRDALCRLLGLLLPDEAT
ncbi:MAG TPA: hypothetical protein VFS21_06100, partial [Roseiflexaceae bacterium]|nr:hypothetical protein [Roseiflexaceae bacterium]